MKTRRRTTIAPRAAVIVAVAMVASLHALIGAPAEAYVRPGDTELLSQSSSGRQGEYCRRGDVPTEFCPASPAAHSPLGSSMSSNGRFVAFASAAGGLVDGDRNGHTDIFVRDRKRGTTRIASVSSDGQVAQGHAGAGAGPLAVGPKYYGEHGGAWMMALSYDPAISANGRYVAFTSAAANLVPGDTNGAVDVFVHDLSSGRTERVSVDSQGKEGVLDLSTVRPEALLLGTAVPDSFYASISANGRYVSFSSFATNFAERDDNGWVDVFVHDRKSDRTRRVSVRSNGAEAQTFVCQSQAYDCRPWTLRSSISPSGRWIVFDSVAPDLVPGDTNGIPDVFLHDRKTRKTERVSLGSNGIQADDPAPQIGWSSSGSSLTGSGAFYAAGRAISANGRYVTFVSRADNLIPNDTNRDPALTGDPHAGQDVFVRDRKTNRTTRISVSGVGHETNEPGKNMPIIGNVHYHYPAIDASGRYVAFSGIGLVNGKYAAAYAIYVHDLHTGATQLVSRMLLRHDGEESASEAANPDISSGGRFISFASGGWPEGARTKDKTDGTDYFIHDRGDTLGAARSRSASDEEEGEPATCVGEVCIPPVALSGTANEVAGSTPAPTTDILGATVARRPAEGDLFFTIEVRSLAGLPTRTRGPADPATTYGVRFRVKGRTFEVRATHALGAAGQFGLFRCRASSCGRMSSLRGGYGTTGERLVVSVPVRLLGLERGGDADSVSVFSARGTGAGPQIIHDSLALPAARRAEAARNR
jgi:Tol biopolymer transport system component